MSSGLGKSRAVCKHPAAVATDSQSFLYNRSPIPDRTSRDQPFLDGAVKKKPPENQRL